MMTEENSDICEYTQEKKLRAIGLRDRNADIFDRINRKDERFIYSEGLTKRDADKLKESLKELLANIVYDLIIKMEQIKGRKYYEKYARNEVAPKKKLLASFII
jgi:hypothetical protein